MAGLIASRLIVTTPVGSAAVRLVFFATSPFGRTTVSATDAGVA